MTGKLAWLNLWRNRGRTLITLASIFFAVLLASAMSGIQRGAWARMIDTVVRLSTGYVQVHRQGYWEEQSLDLAFDADGALLRRVEALPGVGAVAPRLQGFALASAGDAVQAALVLGVSPEREDDLTGLRQKVERGRYPRRGEPAALLASGLAEKMDLAPGDTLVLLGQGYHGTTAAGKYAVAGIAEFGSPDLNERLVYLPLAQAQVFFAAPGQITSLALGLEDPDALEHVVKDLRRLLADHPEDAMGPPLAAMGWREMLPELVQSFQADTAGFYIMIGILYLVVSFGIFSTVLMMTFERRHEFGMLLAIGMKKGPMSLMVLAESLMMAVMGTAAGILGSIPILILLRDHPIRFTGEAAEAYERFGVEPVFPAVLEFPLLIEQGLIVLAITLVVSLYPLLKVRGMDALEAMRS